MRKEWLYLKIIKLPLLKEEIKKRKVAAYTRVSVSSDSLLHSLANQVSHYTEMIKKNPEWEFVQVYVDEGITGTSTESREQFLKMMDDARAGRFDLLLTKSVSRFARNTVDLLESCRELKSLNVEVRFEKDRISTFNSDGELVLSLLASFAQAESESISQNVKWGKNKQMQDGVYHHFSRCYGYDWDGDIYKIVEKEAEVVRFIYKAYLDRMSPKKISELITEKTVTGKNFTRGTVKDILKNRIYIGDRVLQQFYSPRVRKCTRNYGEVPKYILSDVHEPIIDRESFENVQAIMQQKAKETPKKTFNCFSGKVKCGHCERALCRRTLHGKKIWKCQGNEISKTCHARYISEEKLKEYTFSIFEDENEFKIKVDHIKVYDDYLEYIFKDGTLKMIERKEPKRRCRQRK